MWRDCQAIELDDTSDPLASVSLSIGGNLEDDDDPWADPWVNRPNLAVEDELWESALKSAALPRPSLPRSSAAPETKRYLIVGLHGDWSVGTGAMHLEPHAVVEGTFCFCFVTKLECEQFQILDGGWR